MDRTKRPEIFVLASQDDDLTTCDARFDKFADLIGDIGIFYMQDTGWAVVQNSEMLSPRSVMYMSSWPRMYFFFAQRQDKETVKEYYRLILEGYESAYENRLNGTPQKYTSGETIDSITGGENTHSILWKINYFGDITRESRELWEQAFMYLKESMDVNKKI